MSYPEIENILIKAGIRPTANRITVLRHLLQSPAPVCLADLEAQLLTIEKSSLSRTLATLLDKGLLHAMEDGRGITRFECCHAPNPHSLLPQEDDDTHAHFYCEHCHRVYCLPAIPAPRTHLPQGFTMHSINYMLKGICPQCNATH